MENNNYVVIQPPSDEGDAEEQIDQVFGSKINSQSQKKASSSSLKLDIGQSNQLYLNDPKMDSFRGYDRPSPYRQHEAASTSPLESVFRSSLPSVREEASYNNGYHQSLQSVMGPPQDTRYPDWSQQQPIKGYRKSPELTQQPSYRQYSNTPYADPLQSQPSWAAYQSRASESQFYGAQTNQRYGAPSQSYTASTNVDRQNNRYGNMPFRSPMADPYATYGGSFGDFSSASFGSRDELNPFSPGSRSSLPQTPTAGSSQSGKSPSASKARNTAPPDGYIYQVQFKRAHKNYILAPSAPRDILPGDFVKVEADRGEDMGIVLAKIPESQFEEVIPTAGYRGRGFSSGQGERKYLYRIANAEERTSLVQKVIEEEKALETIREKAMERGYPMTVLDAEYQFDRHKLTFYFEADRRIDFRELVSELFSQYKTRIWMQQVDTSSLPYHDPGTELAKATGFLPEREEIVSSRSSFSLGGETTKDPSLAGSTESDSHFLLHEDFNISGCSTSRIYPDIYSNSNASFSLPANDPWSTSRF